MIVIKTHGHYHFEKTCEKCGCEFEYDMTDLHHTSAERDVGEAKYLIVQCPECGTEIQHAEDADDNNKEGTIAELVR